MLSERLHTSTQCLWDTMLCSHKEVTRALPPQGQPLMPAACLLLKAGSPLADAVMPGCCAGEGCSPVLAANGSSAGGVWSGAACRQLPWEAAASGGPALAGEACAKSPKPSLPQSELPAWLCPEGVSA